MEVGLRLTVRDTEAGHTAQVGPFLVKHIGHWRYSSIFFLPRSQLFWPPGLTAGGAQRDSLSKPLNMISLGGHVTADALNRPKLDRLLGAGSFKMSKSAPTRFSMSFRTPARKNSNTAERIFQ